MGTGRAENLGVYNYAGSTRTMRARPENTIEKMDNPKKETDWFEFYFNYQRVTTLRIARKKLLLSLIYIY
jgi:hypothetical protein